MSKTLLKSGTLAALAVAGMIAASATPASADYYRRGWSPGAAAAVGVVGGLALGSALAAPRPAYGYGYGYGPGYGYGYAPRPVYVAPPRPVYVQPAPDCFFRRERVWVPGWGWQVRRVRVCDDY